MLKKINAVYSYKNSWYILFFWDIVKIASITVTNIDKSGWIPLGEGMQGLELSMI